MSFTQLKICKLTFFIIQSADQKIGNFFTWGIIYYSTSTLAKMLLYATAIPHSSIEAESYDLTQELLKILINCIEVFFILMALQNKSSFNDNETHLKVTTVGLAWSLSESVFSYLLYFLINATSEEFKWEYIQTSIIANIDLIERISIVALVECYRKFKETKKFNLHFLLLLIIKFGLNSIGPKYISFLDTNDAWKKIGNKLITTLGFAMIVKVIFGNINFNREESSKKKIN